MDPKEDSKHEVWVKECSLRVIITAFVSSALLAFGMGKIASSNTIRFSHEGVKAFDDSPPITFPVPQLIEGKSKPDCVSTNKYFNSSVSISSLFLDMNEDDDFSMEQEQKEIQVSKESEDTCTVDQNENKCNVEEKNAENSNTDNDDDNDEEHLPAGQHLLVDVINVDKSFLSSELRLAQAMMDIVNQSKLTLLSYHCHTHVGVSCVGVLLESHIAFHTWPEKGAITLDLFTCGSGELVPLMPLIENLFAVPEAFSEVVDAVKKPFVNWSHKLRGFRTKAQSNHIFHDIGDFYELSHTAEKKEIATLMTNFQRFDVFDFFDHSRLNYESHVRSLFDDSSYEFEHQELYQLERVVFLDGVIQSGRTGIEAYYEALVHPAMFANEEPERVAIIGGFECATLREVLKHKSVEEVKMIETDEEIVELSRKYLPDWSDCSDLEGSTSWCGDDDRVDLHIEHPMAWFNKTFSKDAKIHMGEYDEDPFDVLIMDTIDPGYDVFFADELHTSGAFFNTLYNALAEDGTVVFHLGRSPKHNDPPKEESGFSGHAHLAKSLGEAGFKSVHLYEESHASFGEPWSFLVAMKDEEGAVEWNRNLAEINLDIHRRIVQTHSGSPALKHFDGSTMESYRIPNIVFQDAYCKTVPTPESCSRGLDQSRKNIPMTSFEVKISKEEGGGRGVFTKVDIEKGTYMDVKESTKKVHFSVNTIQVMWDILQQLPSNLKQKGPLHVYRYAEGYGWQTTGRGGEEYFVDSGIVTFVNHGCNGSYNVDDEGYSDTTEQSIDISFLLSDKRDIYDPFIDRNYLQVNNAPSFALRDIKAGEEILCNYLTFCEEEDGFEEEMRNLKRVCNNEAKGDILEWESTKDD